MKNYKILIYDLKNKNVEKIKLNNERLFLKILSNILYKEKINNNTFLNNIYKDKNLLILILDNIQLELYCNNNRFFKDVHNRLDLYIKASINLNTLESIIYIYDNKNYNVLELIKIFEKKIKNYKYINYNHYSYVNKLYLNDLLNGLKDNINTYESINLKNINYYVNELIKNL